MCELLADPELDEELDTLEAEMKAENGISDQTWQKTANKGTPPANFNFEKVKRQVLMS
jgi:hypothetical protein